MNGKWRVKNERKVYESDWLNVSVREVEMPDGTDAEHHMVTAGKGGTCAVVHEPDKGILLLWRHRLSGDQWGWELPGGLIDEKEKASEAAAREVLEETGWRPGPMKSLAVVQPNNGFLDHPCHFFFAEGATWEGTGPDGNEVADIAWVTPEKVRELISKGEMSDNLSISALLWAMTFGPLSE